MQYWDDVLYPPFRAMIRGEYYGVVTPNFIDEECYNLARRAIVAFKFPKTPLTYTTFYATRDCWDDNELVEVTADDPNAVPHAYFNEEVGYAEIEILIAWMKVYWCESLISNSDNFEDMYTDSNIKTYSRANAVAQNIKMMAEFRDYAKDLENRYSRVNATGKASLGDVN